MISEFGKERIYWTKKMNKSLVKFMKNKPNIWNPQHPKYTIVEDRDKTYAEFAAKYDNQFTGQAVKHRWTNIRSTFAHYLRKIQKSRLKADSEEYKVTWHLWEPCKYLLKVSKGKVSQEFKNDMIDSNDSDEEVKSDEEESRLAFREYRSTDNVLENTRNTTNLCGETESRLEYKEHSSTENVLENTPNTANLSCRGVAKHLVSILKGVQNNAFGLENTKNGKLGRMVTERLCELNSFEAAKASQDIINILIKYDKSNPFNPNNIKSEL